MLKSLSLVLFLLVGCTDDKFTVDIIETDEGTFKMTCPRGGQYIDEFPHNECVTERVK
jgi:hypothetical protein